MSQEKDSGRERQTEKGIGFGLSMAFGGFSTACLSSSLLTLAQRSGFAKERKTVIVFALSAWSQSVIRWAPESGLMNMATFYLAVTLL
jgi:hypothetical protein